MNLSVLLPVYNAGKYLEPTIKSILAQDIKDFEFLIINDSSTDESGEVIERLAADRTNVRVIHHQKNMGLSATLNEGLNLSTCRFVVRMDQDDIALPSRLRIQYLFMKSRPHLAAAGSYVYHMGINESFDKLIILPTEPNEIREKLPNANCLYHPAVILDRDKVLEAGGYRPEFKNAEDYDLWLRLSRFHDLANIPIPLLRYRFTLGGMTFGRKWEQLYFALLAQSSHRLYGESSARIEESAKKVYASQDKVHFMTMVAQGTATELFELVYEKNVISFLMRFAKDIGWKKAAEIGWKVLKQRGGNGCSLKPIGGRG